MVNWNEKKKKISNIKKKGSLNPKWIFDTCESDEELKKELISDKPTELRKKLQEMKLNQFVKSETNQVISSPQNKVSNWKIFDYCNIFLQTFQNLKSATKDICSSLIQQNVLICELRFCPQLHTLKGLKPFEAVEAVIEGIKEISQENKNFRGGVNNNKK